ncbi:MAG: zinc ribbon domain-containing protein, partial [Candidatus Absconditabacteria bacterium]
FCIACSMPLIKKEDFWNEDETTNSCTHCTNEDGTIKSGEEIFRGGVDFFVGATGVSQDLAEKLVRKNMNQLDYWKGKNEPCLFGEEATDIEFAQAMEKLA